MDGRGIRKHKILGKTLEDHNTDTEMDDSLTTMAQNFQEILPITLPGFMNNECKINYLNWCFFSPEL